MGIWIRSQDLKKTYFCYSLGDLSAGNCLRNAKGIKEVA